MLSVITISLNQSGFVKRRCEADSRWLPPDFSECVSKDYQTLFDKVKQLLEKIGLCNSKRYWGARLRIEQSRVEAWPETMRWDFRQDTLFHSASLYSGI